MKSPPLLALAALAAFAPGVCTSSASKPKKEPKPQSNGLLRTLHAGITAAFKPKKATLNYLPSDAYNVVSKDLTEKDQGNYAMVNREAYLNVEQFRDKSLRDRILQAFHQPGLAKPDPEIIRGLVAARTLGTKSYIPLGRFIGTSGGMSPVSPPQLQKLARIVLPLATGDAKAIIVSDPHSLLQLARAAGSSEVVTALFRQNAKRFNNGLGIDITWTKNGFLDWFLSAIDPKNTLSALHDVLSAIRFSRRDLSAIWCAEIYSALGPTGQTHRSPLTSDSYATILERIYLQTAKIWNIYDKYDRATVQPLPSKLPASFNPVAFDFQKELDTCIKESPSIMALAAGLASLLDKDIPSTARKQSESKLEPTIQMAMQAVDMSFEDMLWLMFSAWRPPVSTRENLLLFGYKNTLGAIGMRRWLFRELFRLKRYEDIVHAMRALTPEYSGSSGFGPILRFIGETKNGAVLDNDERKKLSKMLMEI